MQPKNSIEKVFCRFDSFRDHHLASTVRKNASTFVFLGPPKCNPDNHDQAERILSSFVLSDLVQRIESFLDNLSSHEDALCGFLKDAEELLSIIRLQR